MPLSVNKTVVAFAELTVPEMVCNGVLKTLPADGKFAAMTGVLVSRVTDTSIVLVSMPGLMADIRRGLSPALKLTVVLQFEPTTTAGLPLTVTLPPVVTVPESDRVDCDVCGTMGATVTLTGLVAAASAVTVTVLDVEPAASVVTTLITFAPGVRVMTPLQVVPLTAAAAPFIVTEAPVVVPESVRVDRLVACGAAFICKNGPVTGSAMPKRESLPLPLATTRRLFVSKRMSEGVTSLPSVTP